MESNKKIPILSSAEPDLQSITLRKQYITDQHKATNQKHQTIKNIKYSMIGAASEQYRRSIGGVSELERRRIEGGMFRG